MVLVLGCVLRASAQEPLRQDGARTLRPADAPPLPDGLYASILLERGEILAELYPQHAPLTVANFVGLAEGTVPTDTKPAGEPFYDGLTFHRVVDGFVVQGGDPLGNGEGGPGYEFADEFTAHLKHDAAGVLAMANAGPNTNGSQFYFTLNPVNRLNYKHTVFGKVVRGFDLLTSIKQGDVMERVRIIRVGIEAGGYRVEPQAFHRMREGAHRIAPRHAALPPLFVDDAGLELPEFYPAWLNDKLHHYAEVRGITIFVSLLPHLEDTNTPDAASEALARLHESLTARSPRTATLVYSADERLWRLWLGDGLFGALGATPDLMADVKQRLLAGATQLVSAGEYRRSIDSAVTDLIESLDAGEFHTR